MLLIFGIHHYTLILQWNKCSIFFSFFALLCFVWLILCVCVCVLCFTCWLNLCVVLFLFVAFCLFLFLTSIHCLCWTQCTLTANTAVLYSSHKCAYMYIWILIISMCMKCTSISSHEQSNEMPLHMKVSQCRFEFLCIILKLKVLI